MYWCIIEVFWWLGSCWFLISVPMSALSDCLIIIFYLISWNNNDRKELRLVSFSILVITGNNVCARILQYDIIKPVCQVFFMAYHSGVSSYEAVLKLKPHTSLSQTIKKWYGTKYCDKISHKVKGHSLHLGKMWQTQPVVSIVKTFTERHNCKVKPGRGK